MDQVEVVKGVRLRQAALELIFKRSQAFAEARGTGDMITAEYKIVRGLPSPPQGYIFDIVCKTELAKMSKLHQKAYALKVSQEFTNKLLPEAVEDVEAALTIRSSPSLKLSGNE